jgi:hypothetical protein
LTTADPDKVFEVSCPRCGAAVALRAAQLRGAPKLVLGCAGCAERFSAAVALLRLKARGIAPVGDTERPFERPEVLARFAEIWGEDE